MVLKIIYLVILCLFLVAFIANFIISLLRDLKAKKQIKKNPKHQEGVIKDVKKGKGRIYIIVEFRSSHNRLLLAETFELFESDINVDDYYVGKEVDLIYNDVSNVKKVKNFPLLLSEFKVKLEKGLLFLNSVLIAMSIFVLVNALSLYITKNAFTTDIPLVGENGLYTNSFYILLMFVVYMILCNYMVSNIFDVPRKDIQNYLKLYGNIAKARVVTYKFGKSKNQKGNKESIMTIEFSTNTGETVQTRLTSFLYTETQEEYIDILYDPKNPKMVVYLKQ